MTAAGVAHRFLPRVERHETRRVALAALSFVCLAAGALIARAAGDALFLVQFGSGSLPNMYIAGGIATGLGTFACLWASRRLSTGRIAIAVGGLLVTGNLALFASFHAFPAASRAGAYLLADVSVRIPFFLFWALASEVFDARESRRVFGLIGAAGTAACLPAGLLVGPFARRAGAESLVLLSAALMGGFVLSAATLVRGEQRRASSAKSLGTGGTASARRLLLSPQFVSIAALAVMTSLVATVVDYQFKAAAASNANSTTLADLFGSLYATTSIVSLFLQLLVVHRLLAVAGVFGSLCVLPGALLLTQAGAFRFPSLEWVFAVKACDITLNTTINGTARQLLFRGIRAESRLTARALIDGLFLPLAIGLAGAGLGFVSGSVSVRVAATGAGAAFMVWIVLARRAYRAYVSGLLDALEARRFDFSREPLVSSDPALREWLRQAFGSAPDEDVIYLAGVVPQIGRLVGAAQLKAALARENPRLKVAVLQSLRGSGLKESPELAASLSRHADPEVRRAAVLASVSTNRPADWTHDALADPEPRVRAAAAASFASAGDAPVRSRGRERLEAMARSEDPRVRAAAAEALEHVEDPSVIGREFRTRLLRALLEDGDASVVLAALEALRTQPQAELASPVLSLLGLPVFSGAASDALVAMGPAMIDPARSLFESPSDRSGGAVLAKMAQVLEKIGDPRGLAVIRRMLDHGLPEERTPVFRSYVQLIGREGPEGAPTAEIDALVVQECQAAAARLSSVRRLGQSSATRLARDAVSDLLAGHIENAFILLSARVRNVDMMVLHGKIARGVGEERSHALELLENVLPVELRAWILGVLEPGADTAPAEPAAEVLALLSERDSEWIVAGAAVAAVDLALASCGERLDALKSHESSVVRETALFAADRLGGAR